MEELLRSFSLTLAAVAEFFAALIVALAVLEASARALTLFMPSAWRNSRTHHLHEKEQVRLRLGRWLTVALEFLLAADVLRTAVAPTWDDIARLAAIVAIRTLLNYFLEKEIQRAEARYPDAREERGS